MFKSRNVTTNETVAIKKMSMLRTRDGLPTSVIREAALLKRVGKTDSANLIKYIYLNVFISFSNVFIDFHRLKEVFSEQSNDERQHIYFIFEYVERDLERYLKLYNPLDINQIRVCLSLNSSHVIICFSDIEFYSTIINSCINSS